MRGAITPQFCERTDKFGNTLRFGELGIDELIRPVVGGFTANSPAEAAGLKVGDLLLTIDGKPIDYFSRIPELIGNKAAKRDELNKHLRKDQVVIDLVNLDKVRRADGASSCEGICW